MNILGITGSIGWDGNISTPLPDHGEAWVHGSGASLVMDGVLKNAMCEERFTRIKYDGHYPKQVIKNILQANNLTNEDIDLVVYVGNCCHIGLSLKEIGYTTSKLKERFPNSKVEFLSHHMAHVSATYYTSDFESANVFTFDGAGDYVWVGDKHRVPHFLFSHCEGLQITEISTGFANDPDTFFGAIYGKFAAICYKVIMNHLGDVLLPSGIAGSGDSLLRETIEHDTADRETYPGKIMGLAAYGDHTKINLPDIFELDLESSVFPQLHNSPAWSEEAAGNGTEQSSLIKLNPADLAAWSQEQFEKYLFLFLSNIPESLKNDNLCLGGGCALNILANTKIVEQGIYKNIHVNTAPNDDGLCLGAALWCAVKYKKVRPTLPVDVGYLGINYSDEDIENVLQLDYEKFDSFLELCKRVVKDLKDNKTVGWFQDKSEFGPRALGNRSLLVNPIIDNKDYLNKKVKYREYWRPYAPMVIEEEVQDWFTMPVDKSPHMLFNSLVVEDKKERIPSVVHEDGSARVQTVSEINNKKVYMLLQEFFKETGVPVLLNTSFNLGGEPIVESPADAVRTFTNSNIDVLVMQNYYCRKND